MNNNTNVSMCDLDLERCTIGLDAMELESTFKKCSFINGPQVRQLENMIKDKVNIDYMENARISSSKDTNVIMLKNVFDCVTCANGTDALEIILRCISAESNVPLQKQSVLTSNFSFIASASCVKLAGIPNIDFYDIKEEKGEYNCDVDSIMKHVTEDTIAVIAVSLFGHPAELTNLYDQIANFNDAYDLNIMIIEDAAQSFGSRESCSAVDFSSISFYPSKVLGAYGDGGAIICRKQYTDRIRSICNHGVNKSADKYSNDGLVCLGRNSRLDTFQACILLKKMANLTQAIESRVQVANMYNESLKCLMEKGLLYTPVSHESSVYAQYTIQLCDNNTRDSLKAFLELMGIQSQIFYPTLFSDNRIFNNTHEAPVLSSSSFHGQSSEQLYPNAWMKTKTVLSIPIYAYMPVQKTQQVIDSIFEFFNNK